MRASFTLATALATALTAGTAMAQQDLKDAPLNAADQCVADQIAETADVVKGLLGDVFGGVNPSPVSTAATLTFGGKERENLVALCEEEKGTAAEVFAPGNNFSYMIGNINIVLK